ncbi:hypothetical protein VZT92_010415 [Zoarces viviparus]|uniref:Uncharacterized protein n=1 Tax=Zoarces viviparus TaxID=48416 RepID=A0AAW1FEJ8_ZOAVI
MPTCHKRTQTTAGQTFLLFFFFLIFNHQVTGSVLESLIAKRTEYWEECNRTLATTALPETGIYCRGTFDTRGAVFGAYPSSTSGSALEGAAHSALGRVTSLTRAVPPQHIHTCFRKSLSSSDGEMTLGETMEEILEESQF